MSCVWVYFCMIVATTVSVMGAPEPDCSAASLQELPPRVRTMCEAYDRLSNLLQSYIDDQANYQTMIREGNQIYPSGVKRQDVDHVFLRFGRRR